MKTLFILGLFILCAGIILPFIVEGNRADLIAGALVSFGLVAAVIGGIAIKKGVQHQISNK